MVFNQLIGHTVLALIPRWHEAQYFKIKILSVEYGGVWLECQEITGSILSSMGQSMSVSTPLLFVPYHEFAFVMTSLAVPGLNEKALL